MNPEIKIPRRVAKAYICGQIPDVVCRELASASKERALELLGEIDGALEEQEMCKNAAA